MIKCWNKTGHCATASNSSAALFSTKSTMLRTDEFDLKISRELECHARASSGNDVEIKSGTLKPNRPKAAVCRGLDEFSHPLPGRLITRRGSISSARSKAKNRVI